MANLKSVTVTSANTWSGTIDIPEGCHGYARAIVYGVTSNGSKIRFRVEDPDDPGNYGYSDDILGTAGQTSQEGVFGGPCTVAIGCKTGEFGTGDSATATMRLVVVEHTRRVR